jgi:hypothetical protein
MTDSNNQLEVRGWLDHNLVIQSTTQRGDEMATLEQVAQRMIDECLDYADHESLDDGQSLASYIDGIWVCDTHDSCNMNTWTKVRCVIAIDPPVIRTATYRLKGCSDRAKRLLTAAHWARTDWDYEVWAVAARALAIGIIAGDY